MTYFAVAGLQINLQPSNNLDLLVAKTRTALARFPWIQMVVCSELAICGTNPSSAIPMPGDLEKTLCALAKELGIWLVPGSLYEECEGKIFNTTPVIDPDGKVVCRYRKMYPFLPYEKNVAAGDTGTVFDVPGVGRFGLSICYDIWFPETSRALAWEGAEVLLHPTLTNTLDRDVECAMTRATAAQNQFFVIDVNGTGQQAFGRSMFVGPDGDVLHAAGQGEELIVMEIDISRARRSRERGLTGLGQPLKSFRDAGHRFPQYEPDARSEAFDALGPLDMPERNS